MSDSDDLMRMSDDDRQPARDDSNAHAASIRGRSGSSLFQWLGFDIFLAPSI